MMRNGEHDPRPLPQSITNRLSVVFSTWRLTLDMVQKGLDDAGIARVQFDGKVPQKDRQPILERFKTDPGLRVMLLTLSCGATGFVFDLDS